MADMPRLVKPMLASLRHEFPADEEDYGWELKWDGAARGGLRQRRRGAAGLADEKEMAGKLSGAGRAGPMRRCPGDPGRRDRGAARRASRLRVAAVAHARAAARRHAGRGRAGALLRVRRAVPGPGCADRPAVTPSAGPAGGSRPGLGPVPYSAVAPRRGRQGAGREHHQRAGGSVGKPLSSAYHPGQRRD